MLIIVGWSSVVVWLNVRPRLDRTVVFSQVGRPGLNPPQSVFFNEEYGWPFTVAVGLRLDEPPTLHPYPGYKWNLAGNIFWGLSAVAVLTFASKYLLRAIVAGSRALLSKPPPTNGKGPKRADGSL
jgi:hypothetical protein